MLQTRNSPIIVGEQYELAETLGHGGDNDTGLLAKSEYQAALLSMSEYDRHAASAMTDFGSRKPSQIYATIADYSTGRTATDGSYYSYAPPELAGSQVGTPSSTYGSTTEQALYESSPSFGPRTVYDATQSIFNQYGVRKSPVVDSYSPVRGNKGTQLNIYLRSEHDLLADPPLLVSVVFGLHQVPATLSRLDPSGPQYVFVATATAPNFSETAASTTQLQLHLQLQEKSGQDAGFLEVGYFQYVASVLGSSPQVHDGSKKRKLSGSGLSPAQNFDKHSFVSNASYAYPPSLHSNDSGSTQRRFTPYGRAQNKFRDITSQRGTRDLSMETVARSLMRPPHSQSTTFSPPYSIVSSSGRTTTLDSSSTSSAPLIRTSHLQQSPGASPAGPMAGSAFNPYPIYGQKAVLKLRGNLNSMTENWTPEEWTAKRRLVQFFRSRDGCTVNAQFAPVKPEDRQPNSITISCIWWEERQECFATSVDTIALLEQLVDNRFTVEEKNRIRRNLEGFKPLTVAKGKADSEEFFKVIMGFPNPKPRNIEKDVKVFEWKVLAGALKKIMSKYSASHSSTAGPLHSSQTPVFSGYQSDPSTDRYARVSRSASNSTASSNYAHTLKSNLPSPAETLPSQYTEAPTSASLTGIGHSYNSPSLAPSFHSHDQSNTSSPPIGHLGTSFSDHASLPHTYPATSSSSSLERSRSYHTFTNFNDNDGNAVSDTTTDSDNQARYIKRPRASTTSSSITVGPSSGSGGLYHLNSNDTASAYAQASRSFSEQPGDHHHHHHSHHSHRDSSSSIHLPGLSEHEHDHDHDDYHPTATMQQQQQVYMPQPQRSSVLAGAGAGTGGGVSVGGGEW